MPNSCSSCRLGAETNSPHTFALGKRCLSTRATDHPARASKRPVVEPAGPPPIIMASYVIAGPLILSQEAVTEGPRRMFLETPVAIRWPKLTQFYSHEP